MSIVLETCEKRTARPNRSLFVDPPLKSRTSLLGGLAWTLLLASVAGFFACRTGTSPTNRIVQKPIEQVRLLDRMAGTNPIRSDTETLPEPDPATSRIVKLQLHDDDSQLVEIEMVQSLSWLKAFDAKIGRTIDLDLPEVGAVGEATVVAIEPCPPIPPGNGNLVTALFKHHAKQALNLHVANSSEPIGVTPNHPIWSEDRQAFVFAGQLQPGERLRTRTGETTTIVGVMPRPGPEPVYNLQVHGEHVYRVGTAGLLVHNKAASLVLTEGRIFAHYTNEAGFEAIQASGALRANNGRLYLTTDALSAEEAFTHLFGGNTTREFAGKGKYIFEIELKPHVRLSQGTQANELIANETLREGRDFTIIFAGLNPY